MRKRFITVVISLILMIVILSAGIAGCGSQETTAPGATTTAAGKPDIKVGIMGGLTGTGKSAVIPSIEELEMVLRYTNEVEGGIDGARVRWSVVDNQGTPDGAIQAYKTLRDGFRPDIYLIIEDYLYAGVKNMIEEDEAVIISMSSLMGALYNPPGRFFTMSIASADGFAGFASWALEDFREKNPQESRAPKIGVLYWDMPSGLQWRVAEGWVRGLGIDLVPVAYSMTSIDLKPQFMQLRDAGVDYIWMYCITQQAALAIRDFAGLGLMGKIPFSFTEMVEPRPLIELVGPGATGFYVYRSEDPYSDGSEAAELWSTIWKWGKGEETWSDNRLSITFKSVLEAAVIKAVAAHGWENVNNKTLYEALTSMTVIDTKGNLHGFGFGPDKRMGVSGMKLAQFTATGTVAVTDFMPLPRLFEGID